MKAPDVACYLPEFLWGQFFFCDVRIGADLGLSFEGGLDSVGFSKVKNEKSTSHFILLNHPPGGSRSAQSVRGRGERFRDFLSLPAVSPRPVNKDQSLGCHFLAPDDVVHLSKCISNARPCVSANTYGYFISALMRKKGKRRLRERRKGREEG